MVSFFIQNFGCRVNQAEAFAWAQTLQAAGLRLADDWRTADVLIVNTCTLTGRADRDVNRFLRKAMRENPAARLAITGCAAESLPADVRGSPQVILTLPNSEKEQLPVRLIPLLEEGGRARRSYGTGDNGDVCRAKGQGDAGHREPPQGARRSHGSKPEEKGSDGEESYPYRARAYVKIQDGCDARCTFCIIPSVRGRCRSVPLDDVVGRIRELTDDGFREIVLAGIHLSSYGEDFGGRSVGPEGGSPRGRITLTDLLRRIEKVDGLGRLRLSSLDPGKVDDAFIAEVAGNPLVCQHFHLSLQHASTGILRKMGRLRPAVGSGAGSGVPPLYEDLLSRLRALSPGAAIGADIIAGFPGETDEDFEALEAFLERSPLSYFHVFSYSPRRGTPAADWPQVPEAVKSTRAKRLRRLSAAKNLEFRKSFVGQDLDAIVIARALARGDLEGGPRVAELLTGNSIRVRVKGCPADRRELVRVRITRVLSGSTEGIAV